MLAKLFILGLIFVSCNDEEANTNNTLENPSETHSPEQAIPDSMSISKDSVIVPDSIGDSNY